MEVVDGKHEGQARGGWSHVRRCRSTSRVQSETVMPPDHTAFQMRSSCTGQTRIGPSSGEGLSIGCHKMAQI